MQSWVHVRAALIVALLMPVAEGSGVRGGKSSRVSVGSNRSGMRQNQQATRPLRPGARSPQPEPVPEPPGPDAILVRFTSAPAGADVLINGEFWGSTPTATFTILPAGTHSVVVKKMGYVAWEQRVTLTPGDRRTVEADLALRPYDPTKPRIVGH